MMKKEKSKAETLQQVEVTYAVGGWKFVIEERSFDGVPEFWAFRVGVCEYSRKMPRLIAVCRTFQEAKTEAEKAYRRTEAALENWS